MLCSFCNSKKVLARGLCANCYARYRARGTPERQRMVSTGKCSSSGCEKEAHAKGLCQFHYMRAEHPLKTVWKLLRARHPGQFPEAWMRFETFLADVGERPGPKHTLRRKDEAEPFSADNVFWLPPIGPKSSRVSKSDMAKYGREWRLRRHFGMTSDDYEAMSASQNHCCANCGMSETAINSKAKRAQRLSIDHDHVTGRIRGLLCIRCNRLLGYARDDIDILKRAMAYLESHRAEEAA